jgi:hypothetical protein
VAQLVARSVRDAEVGGSSPLTPTIGFIFSAHGNDLDLFRHPLEQWDGFCDKRADFWGP